MQPFLKEILNETNFALYPKQSLKTSGIYKRGPSAYKYLFLYQVEGENKAEWLLVVRVGGKILDFYHWSRSKSYHHVPYLAKPVSGDPVIA